MKNGQTDKTKSYKLTSLSYKLWQKYVTIQGITNPEIVCTKIVSGSFKVTSCE